MQNDLPTFELGIFRTTMYNLALYPYTTKIFFYNENF